MKTTALILLLVFSFTAIAKDVYVKGYYRKNGTYVSPHVRSAPDSTRSNNYGSTSTFSTGTYDRDRDNDGIYNQYDTDDNNNGIHDDYDY